MQKYNTIKQQAIKIQQLNDEIRHLKIKVLEAKLEGQNKLNDYILNKRKQSNLYKPYVPIKEEHINPFYKQQTSPYWDQTNPLWQYKTIPSIGNTHTTLDNVRFDK